MQFQMYAHVGPKFWGLKIWFCKKIAKYKFLLESADKTVHLNPWSAQSQNGIFVARWSVMPEVWKQFEVQIWYRTHWKCDRSSSPLYCGSASDDMGSPDLSQSGLVWWILYAQKRWKSLEYKFVRKLLNGCISNPLSKMHFICSTTHCKNCECQGTLVSY